MAERSVQLLTVVAPVRDDQAAITPFWEQLRTALHGIPFELLLVDDGSRDQSPQILSRLSGSDSRVKVVMLARHFGREAAVTAGLDHANGNVVALLRRGPLDNPGSIPALISRWRQTGELAYGRHVVVGDGQNLAVLPGRSERALGAARLGAFSCCAAALLAMLAVIVVRLASDDLRHSALIEATVLAIGAVQLALIGLIAGHLPSRDDEHHYVVRERRNIAPPDEPMSELEELVSELDLER